MKKVKAVMVLDPRPEMEDIENYVYQCTLTTNPKRIKPGDILDVSKMRALSKRGYKITLLPLEQ